MANILILFVASISVPAKKWNLEDDSDEEEDRDKGGEKGKEDEEVDPLDAFMQTVESEVRVVNKTDKKSEAGPDNQNKGMVIITGVAKKTNEEKKDKGELIEQNQDGLEYSSEEEEEDLKV